MERSDGGRRFAFFFSRELLCIVTCQWSSDVFDCSEPQPQRAPVSHVIVLFFVNWIVMSFYLPSEIIGVDHIIAYGIRLVSSDVRWFVYIGRRPC